MALANIVQCIFALMVILHPSALISSSSATQLPKHLDNPNLKEDAATAASSGSNSNSGEEESNIILLNNITKKIWDPSSLAPDDIRCYCNLPACVSNGYMCRTARSHPDGGCFSERPPLNGADQPHSLPARHGCTNLLIESGESFKCDNNHHQTVPRRSPKVTSPAPTPRTTVMCCHEDMCNQEGTAGRREVSKALQQHHQQHQQQRIKLNQQRDVVMAPPFSSSSSSSSSSASSSAAALTGGLQKNSFGAAAANQSEDLQKQSQNSRQSTKYSHHNPRGVLDHSSDNANSAETVKQDVVDSEYSGMEQQSNKIKTITYIVGILGPILAVLLVYVGIRMLSNDGSSSPASKLNRSDDSGHIMIGAGSPEGKHLMLAPKYYMAATQLPSSPTATHVNSGNSGGNTAKNLFATNVTPTSIMTATGRGGSGGVGAGYQPLSVQPQSQSQQQLQQPQKNGKCNGDKLSALEYQLLAPELVSKLEKGGGIGAGDDEEEEAASDRLLKPMISSSSCIRSSINSNNNNSHSNQSSFRKLNYNNNTNSAPMASECNCMAKNCRNCCSTNVKFTNERRQQQQQRWNGKDNRQPK